MRDGSAPSESAPDPRIGTPEQFRWLLGLVKVVLALNLLDAIFTLTWIHAGLAREANPLLARIVGEHPVAFAAIKLGLVAGGSYLLWRYRYRPLAVIGIFAAFLVYYLLLLYHVGYLSLVVGTLLFP
ncbi:MAG TPA: DUF5658 family protein [Myxococcota bacterium]|nr:DUF5658 family protein [Myxococcota bacterium]